MELIYLYAEEFRNLKEISFNFTGRYKVNYKPSENALTAEETKGLPKEFFGANISNVTGVIGMNGSGKSNLVELLCLLIKGTSAGFKSKFILVFLENGKLFFKTNIENCRNWPIRARFAQEKSIPNLSVIYFSNVTDNKRISFSEEIIDLSRKSYLKTIGKTFVSETRNQVDFLFSKYRELVELDTPKRMLLTPRAFKVHLHTNELTREFPILYKAFLNVRRVRRTMNPSLSFRCMFRLSVLVYMLKSISRKLNFGGYKKQQSSGLNLLHDIFNSEISETADLKKIEVQLGKAIARVMETFSEFIPFSNDLITQFLSFNEAIDELDPQLDVDPGKRAPIFSFDLSRARSQEIFKHFNSVFSVPDLLDVEWEGLSSGHEAFLNLFSQMHSAIHRVSRNENVMICIDEADLYLHPQWQRQFLDRIVRFVPNIIKRNLQIIITTHSPFLVSDLPNGNLIMLYTEEQRLQNEQKKDFIPQRTFGANIIDLFTGPFFLDNGTISEFALKKIKEAVAIAKKEHPSNAELEEARSITLLIGDGLIRKTITEMLDDKA